MTKLPSICSKGYVWVCKEESGKQESFVPIVERQYMETVKTLIHFKGGD